ncbi:hypothetical protein T07_1128 [Trichinella nelsoni]|uniref:Uncharacterized protein n=1 Tax=Trichinella nelsoni TaxID=6336 RepID=A0A0V0RCA2_9BILA|nr:hypothetical protein T07_1128 [Trichinella nelsoni]
MEVISYTKRHFPVNRLQVNVIFACEKGDRNTF